MGKMRGNVFSGVLCATLIVSEPILAFLYGYGVPTLVYVGLGSLLIPVIMLSLAVLTMACFQLFSGFNAADNRRRNTHAAILAAIGLILFGVEFVFLRGPVITGGARTRIWRNGGDKTIEEMHNHVFGSGQSAEHGDNDEDNLIGVPTYFQKMGGKKAWFLKGTEGSVLVVQSELPHRSGWFVVRDPNNAIQRIETYNLHRVTPLLYRF